MINDKNALDNILLPVLTGMLDEVKEVTEKVHLIRQ